MKHGLLRRGAAVLSLLSAVGLACPPRTVAAGVYFVKQGDTLTGIARIFNVDVRGIQEANRLSGAAIKPGDRLRIPDQSAEPPLPVAEPHAAEPDADRVLKAVCREETVYHTVAKGDTLSAIGRRYGASVRDLIALNGLRRQARLAIGQRVLVRRSGPRTHLVRRGDTLHRLATRYGVPAADLARLNGLADDAIRVGQRLQIEPCDPYAAAGTAPPPLADDAGADASLAFAPLASPGPGPGETGATSAAAPLTERLIHLAKNMLGIPYRFGGTTLRGLDCSAYVQRVFTMLDVKLPRTAREQFAVGARIAREDLAVGDLVFFRTYASFPSHVGIYLGDDLFIHASSVVRKVTIDRLDVPYYRKRFLGARRLVPDASSSLASAP